MLIKPQSKFAKCMTTGLNSEQGEAQSRESPKPSEIIVYLEMGVALIAASGLFAMAAWVLYSAHDWIASIQRFQEMI